MAIEPLLVRRFSDLLCPGSCAACSCRARRSRLGSATRGWVRRTLGPDLGPTPCLASHEVGRGGVSRPRSHARDTPVGSVRRSGGQGVAGSNSVSPTATHTFSRGRFGQCSVPRAWPGRWSPQGAGPHGVRPIATHDGYRLGRSPMAHRWAVVCVPPACAHVSGLSQTKSYDRGCSRTSGVPRPLDYVRRSLRQSPSPPPAAPSGPTGMVGMAPTMATVVAIGTVAGNHLNRSANNCSRSVSGSSAEACTFGWPSRVTTSSVSLLAL